jgi:hypothetical protein
LATFLHEKIINYVLTKNVLGYTLDDFFAKKLLVALVATGKKIKTETFSKTGGIKSNQFLTIK